jgi:hypothetical protein
MAKRRGRTRTPQRNGNVATRSSVILAGAAGYVDPNIVPRVLLGTVDGIGAVATGVLQITRNVLVTAVSGAADIATEAIGATVTGTRGIVSAASRMVGNVAAAAQSSFQEVASNGALWRPRARSRMAPQRPPAVMMGRSEPSQERAIVLSEPVTRRRRKARSLTASAQAAA